MLLALFVLIMLLIGIYWLWCQRHDSKHKKFVWMGNLEQITVDNTRFRTILHTGDNLQLVAMHLEPGQEIGMEKHDSVDQFIRVEKGQGAVVLPDQPHPIAPIGENEAVFIPKGTWHNVIAGPETPLKLYTLYAPPEH